LAKNYFKLALGNAQLRFDYELQATCLNNLATIYLLEKEFEAAIASSINSIKIKSIADNEMETADSYLTLSDIYFQQNKRDTGNLYLKMADSIIDKYDYTAARLLSLLKHAEYSEQEKDFKSAYASLKRHAELSDSLELANQNALAKNSFIDTPATIDSSSQKAHVFPYLYLYTLFILGIGTVLFIFRLKR